MKHKLTFTRHCECTLPFKSSPHGGEDLRACPREGGDEGAIAQNVPLTPTLSPMGRGSFAARAALLVMTLLILIISNTAFACMERPLLYEHFGRSELIFEGHFLRYERIESVDPKDSDKSFYNIIEVYNVDKNWKGAKKGQEIKIAPFGSYSKDGKFPSRSIDYSKQIITVWGNRLNERKDIYSDIIDCPEMYASTWQNRFLLFFRYPLAVFQ